MARHPKKAESLGEWAKEPGTRPRKIPRTLEDCTASVEKRMASGNWKGTIPGELVALYGELHQCVYKCDARDIRGSMFRVAAAAAERFVRVELKDNIEEAVEYVVWAWQREDGREKWRRQNNSASTFRLAWRLLFMGNTGPFPDYCRYRATRPTKPV